MGRVLIGFDGSQPSRRALDHAARRALAAGDEIFLATIIPEQVRGSSLAGLTGLELPREMSRTFEESAITRLHEVATDLKKSGAKVETIVRTGSAAKVLLSLAVELQVAEIVIGHKAFEGPHMTLGHNADEILRGAKVPVTVVP